MNNNQHQDPAQLEQMGTELYRDKKYLKAAEEFSRSAVLFQQAGNLLKAAEQRNNQAVSLLKADRPAEALEAVSGTSQFFAEQGDATKMAMAAANEAMAYQELGRREEALKGFEEAARIFRQEGETDLLLQTSQSISALKLRSRNILGALVAMQDGLEGLEKPKLRQRLLLGLLRIPNRLMGGSK